MYRTITYAMCFLNEEPEHVALVETAFAYHHIALWTDRALAYFAPSETVALADNATYGWGLDPERSPAWRHPLAS